MWLQYCEAQEGIAHSATLRALVRLQRSLAVPPSRLMIPTILTQDVGAFQIIRFGCQDPTHTRLCLSLPALDVGAQVATGMQAPDP